MAIFNARALIDASDICNNKKITNAALIWIQKKNILRLDDFSFDNIFFSLCDCLENRG